MSGLDAAILVAFVLVSLGFGLRARRRASSGLEEYFLAGRSLSGWQAGSSMAATQFAADTPLLVMGLVATAGIFSLWRLWIYAVSFLLLGFLLAPLWRRARVLTDAELAELRYAGPAAVWLRGVKAVYFGTIFNCTVLAMVLWAAKEVAEPFLLWNEWLPEGLFELVRTTVTAVGVPFARALGEGAAGAPAADLWLRSTNNVISILAIAGFTLLYSSTGGLRSVVQTDVLQLALMLAGTALFAAFAVSEVGGLAALPDGVRERFGDGADAMLAFTPSRASGVGWGLLAVFGLQWLVQVNADGTGYLAQRAMACRSDRDARHAALVFTGLQVVLRSLLWLPLALALLLLYPVAAELPAGSAVAAHEAAYVRGMAELLPSGLRGLMLTAMLAALASTIDSHLNWGASYWTNDLYKRFVCERWLGRTPSQSSLVAVARVSSVVILALALAIMTRLQSIQEAWELSLLLGAGMGVPLVLRWLWWRFSAWGELAAIGVSAVLAPLVITFVGDDALRLLGIAFASTAAGVVVSWWAGPEDPERLRAFYERVRPPGFWRGAGGEAAADGAARLGRALGATALASIATFCVLVALGTALVGSPEPLFWPAGRGSWISVLAAVAAGAVVALRRVASES